MVGTVAGFESVTATFLFCDLVGSTALFTKLGDDHADAVRKELFAGMRRAVAAARGREVKSTGDGLLVVFQTSVVDAVACGIGMQRATAAVGHQHPMLDLALRVGVAAGEAVQEDADWYGTPVVEAARLCASARAGQILASQTVHLLAGSRGGYDFTPVGTLDLKGLLPTAAFEIGWEAPPARLAIPLPSPLEALAEPRFVGRAPELASVMAAWRAVRGGAHAALLVTGEQDIGKTRLVAELARSAHADGAVVLYGAAPDTGEPYGAVGAAVARYAAACPPAIWRELVVRHPDLARFIGTGPATALPASRRSVVATVVAFVEDLATEAPVLVVIDGLATADDGTRAVFRELASTTRRGGVLVVGIHADHGVPASSGWTTLDGTPLDHVALKGLSRDEVASLLEAAGETQVDADRAEVLRRETDGNPGLVLALLGDGGGVITCPYRGLVPYGPGDADVFCGREAALGALLGRLSNDRLVVLTGGSGSGKSSLVAAGLVPAVWRGALAHSATWRVVRMVPGARPIAALHRQLAALGVLSEADVQRELAEPNGLARAAGAVLAGSSRDARLLLVVDQAEELFTGGAEAAEIATFLALVLDAVRSPEARVLVVVVIRGDMVARLAEQEEMASALSRCQIVLGAMTDAEVLAAITEPAEHAGLRLQAGLAETLVEDVGHEPGALPLLSHALQETWRVREGRTLTLAGYRAVGGVHGAIAKTADAVVESLPEADRALARRLLVSMVDVEDDHPDSARRVPRAHLGGPDDPAVGRVLEQLAAARLIVMDGESVRLAHEALLRHWPLLRSWVDEDRDELRMEGRLRVLAADWDRAGRDPGELLRGARLAAALEWRDHFPRPLEPVTAAYVTASSGAHEADLREANERAARERRARRRVSGLLGAVAVMLVLAIGLGLLAVVQRSRADSAARQAEASTREAETALSAVESAAALAEARRLSAEALTKSDRQRSLLLAAEGYRRHAASESAAALMGAIMRVPQAVVLVGSTTGPRTVGFRSLRAGRVLAVHEDASASVVDLENQAVLASSSRLASTMAIDARAGVVVASLADDAAGDGGRLVVLHEDLSIAETIATMVDDQSLPFAPFEVAPQIVRLAPDGQHVVTVSSRAAASPFLEYWPLDGGPPLWRVRSERDVTRIDFVGDAIDVQSATGREFHDIATGSVTNPPYPFDERREAVPVGFSAEGRMALLVEADTGRNTVVDLAARRVVAELPGASTQTVIAALTTDGRSVATARGDGSIRVWDVQQQRVVQQLSGHDGPVTALHFARDDDLVSLGVDGSLNRWDLGGTRTFLTIESRLDPADVRVRALFVNGSVLGRQVIRDGQRVAQTFALPAGTLMNEAVVFSAVDRDLRGDYAPDGQLAVGQQVAGGQIFVGGSRLPAGYAGPVEPAAVMGFLPDGERVLVGNVEGSLTIRLARSALYVERETTVEGSVVGLALAPDGRAVAVIDRADGHRELVVVQPDTLALGDPIRLPASAGDVSAVELAAGGDVAVVGTTYGDLIVVDLVRPDEPPLRRTGQGSIRGIDLSPDGSTLATATTDGKVRLFSVPSLDLLGEVPVVDEGLLAVGFIDDGQLRIHDGTTSYRMSTDPDEWMKHACKVAGRSFTTNEWAELFPNEAYVETCA